MYYKAHDSLVENCTVYVYEEIYPDFKERGVKDADMAHSQFKGGLHPSRYKAIKRLHFIEASHAQTLCVRQLDVTLHYSVDPSDVDGMIKIAKAHGIQVSVYRRDKSYVDPGNFIRVYNYETPEFSSIESTFSCIPFEDIEVLVGSKGAGSRNNRQESFGISALDFSSRDSGGISKPNIMKKTSRAVPSFVAMSELAKELNMFQRKGPKHEKRLDTFARKIFKTNILEGLTAAASDDHVSFLATHFDSHNCKDVNDVIVCSRLVMELTNPGEPIPIYRPIRLVEIGYMRKCVSDYLERSDMLTDLVAEAVDFYRNRLPTERKEISREGFSTSVFEEVVEGGGLTRLCNMDKLAFYSAFADPLRKLLDAHPVLKLKDVCDLAVVIPPITEAVKWTQIILDWADGALPAGSLSQAYIEEAYDRFGGFNSGPCARMGVSATKPISHEDLKSSRENILQAVEDLNSQNLATSYVKASAAHSKLVKLFSLPPNKGGVVNCGELGAHHLIAFLVLSGAIRHPVVLMHCNISGGTKTAKRVEEVYKVPVKQFESLLKSIATVLDVELYVAENILCEMTRKDQRNDVFFPGTVYRGLLQHRFTLQYSQF